MRVRLTGLLLGATATGNPAFPAALPFPGRGRPARSTVAARSDPDTLLRRAMARNRSGRWSEAIQFASRVLALKNISRAQRGEALLHLAHAYRCLGEQDMSSLSSDRLETLLTH